MIIEHFHCHNYDEVESTQAFAKEQLQSGSITHGHVITAVYQSLGYGRQERKWHHVYGNIALSIVVNPETSPLIIPQLTYAAGLATFLTIISFKDVNAKLKWVNDILIDGSKVAGIICEMVNNEYAIIGIGVNLKSNDDIRSVNGSSLADFGMDVNREEFITRLLANFKDVYNLWCNYGFNPVRAKWSQHSHKEGDEITVKLRGNHVVKGEFAGIADDGKLILTVDGKPRTISAGEI